MDRSRLSQKSRSLGYSALFLGAALLFAGCDGSSNNSRTPTDPGNEVIGSGILATETRVVQGFSEVSMSSTGRVTIRHTGVESLSITAEDNILPLLTSEVVGDRLILSVEPNRFFRATRDILYDLTVRVLKRIDFTGAGSIDVRGIDTPRLEIGLSGAGDIRAAGRVDRQTINLSGAGDYRARNLESRIAVVNLTGVGTAVLRVSERLEAHVTGVGAVEYYGDPEVTVTGGGTVRRLGP